MTMMSDGVDGDPALLVDIGYAVTALHDRLAGVEAALLSPPELRPVRRRSASRQPGLPSGAMLRRAQQRRRDAAGITWTVWSWDSLTHSERKAAFKELRRFVDWLNVAYELPISTTAVPACWYLHAGAIRELWALVASHRHAYTVSAQGNVSAPSDAPVSWHDRVLWPCLRRLREELGLRECASAGHKSLALRVVKTDDGFASAVEYVASEQRL